MARAAIAAASIIQLTEAGITLDANDVAAETTDGNSFPYKDGRLLCVLNGDAESITVTIVTPATVGRSALAVGDGGGVVAAGKTAIFGPFGPEYRQADGTVHVNYAGTTITGVMVSCLDTK